jgi:PIN domain nuclease of toxin-antitoxin system
LLLDSHALLWLLYDEAMLPDKLSALMRDPAHDLLVSEATLWELGDKSMKGRLPLLSRSLPAFIADIEELGAKFVPVERSDILNSVSLPLHHGDPFDRMLIAQAQARSLTIVSKDRDMPKYDVPLLW